jgi:hypothetical protein
MGRKSTLLLLWLPPSVHTLTVCLGCTYNRRQLNSTTSAIIPLATKKNPVIKITRWASSFFSNTLPKYSNRQHVQDRYYSRRLHPADF